MATCCVLPKQRAIGFVCTPQQTVAPARRPSAIPVTVQPLKQLLSSCALPCLFSLATCSSVNAGPVETIPYAFAAGVHIGSFHYPTDVFCSDNYGAYGRVKHEPTGLALQLGAYKNSHCTGWNQYVMVGWESGGDGWRYCAMAGLAHGYRKDGSPSPMVLLGASHRLPLIPAQWDVSGRVAGSVLDSNRVKAAGKKYGLLVHFMIEKGF